MLWTANDDFEFVSSFVSIARPTKRFASKIKITQSMVFTSGNFGRGGGLGHLTKTHWRFDMYRQGEGSKAMARTDIARSNQNPTHRWFLFQRLCLVDGFLFGSFSPPVAPQKSWHRENGKTEVSHHTFYRSGSWFRDKFIYPYFHTKAINEFHGNVRRAISQK